MASTSNATIGGGLSNDDQQQHGAQNESFQQQVALMNIILFNYYLFFSLIPMHQHQMQCLQKIHTFWNRQIGHKKMMKNWKKIFMNRI